jgi:MFS family permease
MFFFMALYMQNILGYSPLAAGIRFLPSTAVIIVAAPLAGRLTDRIGAKVPIVVGLSLAAVALYLQSQITPTTGYGHLLPSFVLMGLGIGLTMSPMSTAAMNSVDPAKAGGASGILSMSRMVGGTFGVAAVGALFQSLSDNKLNDKLADLPLTASQKSWFIDNLGSGDVGAHLRQLPPETASQVGQTLRDTFISSLSSSMRLSAAVAAVGALIALVAVEHVKQRRPDTVPAIAQDVGRAAPAQPQLPAKPASSP